MMTLTFENPYFQINAPTKRPDENWEEVGFRKWRTTNLKAAAWFRPYANELCEKVFDRAFNCAYEAPHLPQLSFLDAHQLEGVKWILSRKRSYLAHAPGAGKTAQAIVAATLTKGKGQIVFIVPPSLTVNWEREIWKFTKDLIGFPTVGIVPVTAHKSEMAWNAQYIVVPDSMLSKPWVYARLAKMRIKFLAVDEASRFKDHAAQRSIALYGGRTKYRTYPGLFQAPRHVVFLDGSPMPNRPMELWAPTYALDPSAIDCMSRHDFGLKFCGATMGKWGWEYNYSSNELELKSRLQESFMHVVTEDKLSHPERRRSMLFINKDIRTPELKTWERDHLKTLKFSELSESLSQGQLAEHRKKLGILKMPWVAAYVIDRMRAKPGESILIFVWHREVAEELNRRIPYSQMVIGGTSVAQREKYFEQFQNGSLKVIIGNIAAMGRGVNLQKADRVIFGESSWSDELNKQCEKRASRRGRNQNAFVRCEYVVATGTMDEPIMNGLFVKQKRVEKIIG